MPEPRVQRVQLHPLPQLNGCSTGAVTGAVRVQYGCSGCKCTPCLLHFQLCGCSSGADYGCNRCTMYVIFALSTEIWPKNEIKFLGNSCHVLVRKNFWPLKWYTDRKIFGDGGGGVVHRKKIFSGKIFFIGEYALLLTNCTRCPQHLPASLVCIMFLLQKTIKSYISCKQVNLLMILWHYTRLYNTIQCYTRLYNTI